MLSRISLLRIQQQCLSDSARWIRRQQKDVFVKQSKVDGYRCRSAYKLIQLNQKYKLLKVGQNVVDLGASPGSWTQVVSQCVIPQGGNVSNTIIAVDLNEIQPLSNVKILSKHDFTLTGTQQAIQALLPNGKSEVVVSDMAPNASGSSYTDHVRIIELCEAVVDFCDTTLAKSGHMVCKVWDGPLLKDLINEVRRKFDKVVLHKPSSSRKESSEVYVVCQHFR